MTGLVAGLNTHHQDHGHQRQQRRRALGIEGQDSGEETARSCPEDRCGHGRGQQHNRSRKYGLVGEEGEDQVVEA